jgi:hypothetical protein
MSVEVVHLSCWALLASMVVFLVVGGVHTYHELREVLRERRARRNRIIHGGAVRAHRTAFSFA